MYCPNCGNEISNNQKFCSKCGTKLEQTENVPLEESMSGNTISEDMVFDNQNFQANEKNTLEETSVLGLFSNLNGLTKKIIISVSCVILIACAVFGVMQYKQYQKDIEPIEKTINYYKDDVILTTTYNDKHKEAKLSMLHKGTIIEQWQIDCLRNWDSRYELTDKSDSKYVFKFLNAETNLGEPLVLNFKIKDINSSKEFALFKEKFDNISFYRSIPKILVEDKKERLEAKNEWLKWKKEKEAKEEAERKKKEWQEKILSNCVYKTSDGVCFTTQVFEAEPIKIANTGRKDYDRWLGAKDACESKGYKLPSDNDLRSLFQDILGVEVKGGINIESHKYDSTTDIPTNYNILKRIAPNGFSSYGSGTSKWSYIDLWEDKEFDSETAYARIKDVSWGADETYQHTKEKYSYSSETSKVICVYDPNGSPHKSILQTKKEQEEAAKREEKRRQLQQKQAIEDALF